MRAQHRPNWAALGLDLVTLRIFAAAAEERSLARAAVVAAQQLDAGTPFQLCDAAADGRLRDVLALRGARGSVILHANISAISGPLPGMLSSFLLAHPGLRVSLEERTSVEILHAVQTGVAELGIFSGTMPVPEGLTVLPWREDPLVVLVPADHRLAARETLRLADLLEEPFVGLQDPSALQRLYRREAERAGGHLRERVLVASFDGVRRLVEAGLGLSILPAAAMAAGGSGIATRPLAEPWAVRPLALCLRQVAGLSAAARLLVRHLSAG